MQRTHTGTIVNVGHHGQTGSKITIRFKHDRELATLFNNAFPYKQAKATVGEDVTLQYSEPADKNTMVWQGLSAGNKAMYVVTKGRDPKFKPKSPVRDRGWVGETRTL